MMINYSTEYNIVHLFIVYIIVFRVYILWITVSELSFGKYEQDFIKHLEF